MNKHVHSDEFVGTVCGNIIHILGEKPEECVGISLEDFTKVIAQICSLTGDDMPSDDEIVELYGDGFGDVLPEQLDGMETITIASLEAEIASYMQ